MLRGLGRIASLALVVALAAGMVGCSQYGKLQAKRAFKDANVLYQQQEFKKAAALYEEAIANDPGLSVAYFYLANSYDNLFKPSRKGEPENDAYLTKAVEYYKLAGEKETDKTLRTRSFQFLIAAYGPDKLNDPAQQEPIVNRMIQLDPQDPDNYFRQSRPARTTPRSTCSSPGSTTARKSSRRRSRPSRRGRPSSRTTPRPTTPSRPTTGTRPTVTSA
jgi:tetratricopeptide (TPR) repeat protein